jgi:UDP-N-acetylmuramoyl-tripeptide--D-alanyl-D-alanine ligase
MFTREALLAAAEAIPQGGALPRQMSGAVVESRAVRPGQLYIVLTPEAAARGRAIAAAVDGGAVAILATAPDPYALARGVPLLAVADPLAVLRHLARDCLRRQPRTRVIAVAGGADTLATKDAIAALLAHVAPTLRMPAPGAREQPGEVDALLALVNLAPEHGYAVLALGAQGPDTTSMAALCRLLAPHVGIVTPFDPAPPDSDTASLRPRQGSEAVRAAAELLRTVPAAGLAVLDADGRHTRRLAHQATAPVVTYGRRLGVDVRAMRVGGDAARGPRFTLMVGGQQVRVQMGIPGERAVTLALAAAAVALRCGLSLEAVAGALSELRLPKPRATAPRDAERGVAVAGVPFPPAVGVPAGGPGDWTANAQRSAR